MRLPTTRQLLACLVLSLAFGTAGAAELRQTAPEPSAPIEAAPGPSDRMDEHDLDVVLPPAPAPRIQKPKPTTTAPAVRTSGDNRAMPARFHSFLPGMFR